MGKFCTYFIQSQLFFSLHIINNLKLSNYYKLLKKNDYHIILLNESGYVIILSCAGPGSKIVIKYKVPTLHIPRS